ncbi:hypothetical protein GCM10009844_24160 [Nocardioides koreensis]|uniref:Phage holin family protein n=1 Tax=Nocardioides koreensis TaxID=433651 RepID=A0ABN2ZT96_9ACTN
MNDMIERLRKPGGRLGTLSLVSAAILAIIGAVGVVAMVVSLIADADFWANDNGSRALSLVLFALTFLGAVGFLIEDQYPWVGAALAVVGGVAISLLLFWTVLAIVVGLGAAVVAVMRARVMHHGSTTAAHPA